MMTPADPPAACPARPKAASAWRGRKAAGNPSAPKLGWILARGALATVIGLACAAALGEGWFMAVFIPALLTAANVLHWRAAARRGHGPARSTEMPR